MKPRLFFLDDDVKRLEAWQASLAALAENAELHFFRFRKEVRAAIEEGAPAVIITRQDLRRSTGVQALENIAKAHSGIRMILLAPRADREKLQESSVDNLTFLPDPCSIEELGAEINRIVAIESWLGNDRLSALLKRAGSVPSLPTVYLKVMNLLNSSHGSIEDVGDLVSKDVAMSAKLLQVVNSSYFGFGEKVSDIAHAVSMLGTEAVKHLVLAIQVFHRYGKSETERALIDKVWRHSMSVAIAARKITLAETNDREAAEEAYTAGLFHDMGKLLLIGAQPKEYRQAQERARAEKISSWEAEEALLGFDHADAGAYLLGVWQMPLPVIEAVAFHHQPQRAVAQEFSALAAVHAANVLVHSRYAEPGSAPLLPDEDFLAAIDCRSHWDAWTELVHGARPVLAAKVPDQALAPSEAPGHEAFAPASGSAETSATPPEAVTALPAAITPPETAAATPLETPATASMPEVRPPESSPAAEPPSQATRRRHRHGWIPLSPIGWAAASIALILVLAWVLGTRPSAEQGSAGTSLASESVAPVGAPADVPATAHEPVAPAVETTPAQPEVAAVPPAAVPPAAEPAPALPPPTPAVAVPPAPTAPPLVAVAAPASEVDPFPRLRLSGIFYRSSNPAAVINGEMHYVGDRIDGARLVRIDPSAIEVRFGGQSRVIELD